MQCPQATHSKQCRMRGVVRRSTVTAAIKTRTIEMVRGKREEATRRRQRRTGIQEREPMQMRLLDWREEEGEVEGVIEGGGEGEVGVLAADRLIMVEEEVGVEEEVEVEGASLALEEGEEEGGTAEVDVVEEGVEEEDKF